MALKPGDLLGPYALQERLGSGGFGSVWGATRVGSLAPIPVAVKIGHELRSDADGGADAMVRLRGELRKLGERLRASECRSGARCRMGANARRPG